ncbi:MAG: DUF1080 domain-containing protein, partial [Candidatus Latescibacteria bacterium]|nr:DUF1080 domain-containing protein [Candidatus Latescibacterota bacterium]
MQKTSCLILAAGIIVLFTASLVFAAPHPMEPLPKVVSAPAGGVPSDAISLFDGTNMSEWTTTDGKPSNWKVTGGEMIVNKGAIVSKRTFGDIQLHLEFATPAPPTGEGQDRGNSGVYFNGLYEVQVLDSYNSKTYINGQCGAIYENFPPLVNVSRAPGQWQTYDVIFHAPKFNSQGNIMQKANLTVLHNGVLI